jgi:hypothetical protein
MTDKHPKRPGDSTPARYVDRLTHTQPADRTRTSSLPRVGKGYQTVPRGALVPRPNPASSEMKQAANRGGLLSELPRLRCRGLVCFGDLHPNLLCFLD